jgi:hypothetical protein
MSNKKEIEYIFKKYIFKKEEVPTRFEIIGPLNNENIKFLKELVDASEILYFEAPDGYIKLKNYDVLCEHFTVDSSKTINGGSLIKQLTKGVSQNFKINEYIKDVKTEKKLKEKINNLASNNNLIENLKINYINHYNKRESYKQNINKSGEPNLSQTKKIVFFIEDTTPYYELLKTLLEDKSLTAEELKEIIKNRFYQNFKSLDLPLIDYIFYLFYIGAKNIAYFTARENFTK